MRHSLTILLTFLATTSAAQERVTNPNGTVTGTFLGKDIAMDVTCSSSPLFENSAEILTHTPLSQSLIDDVTEDALVITMFNNGASFLANIDGETSMDVNPKIGIPAFPMQTSGDDFNILITCPEDF